MPLRTEHAQALGNEGYAAALQGDPPAMPTENFFLHREYLWGDGGEGPDELLAYVGTNRAHIFYPIQDGSGDVIAIADVTSDGAAGNPNALRPRILEQRTYAPYGEVVDFWQSQEVTSGAVQVPPLAAGHKGLFFERLDAGALTWAGDGYVETHPYAALATNSGATQHPYLIGHARNRTLHTVLGQWNQRDPHGTGHVHPLVARYHGVGISVLLYPFDLATHKIDGANVVAYVRADPVGKADPMGLHYALGIYEYIRDVTMNVVAHYAGRQDSDADWAGDWNMDDNDHSRNENDWVTLAMLEGFGDAAGISLLWDEEQDVAGPAKAGVGGISSAVKGAGRLKNVTRQLYQQRRAAFPGVRKGFWRDQAADNRSAPWFTGPRGHENLMRAKQGKPPIGSDGRPMHLHHDTPLMHGGKNDFENLIPMEASFHQNTYGKLHKLKPRSR